jgi:hypothetical protein
MTFLVGARYLVPYVRLFPIWRYGPIYSKLDGRYVRHGWRPDCYGTWEISREEAEASITSDPTK